LRKQRNIKSQDEQATNAVLVRYCYTTEGAPHVSLSQMLLDIVGGKHWKSEQYLQIILFCIGLRHTSECSTAEKCLAAAEGRHLAVTA
jgi:hypothetical protein